MDKNEELPGLEEFSVDGCFVGHLFQRSPPEKIILVN
jgi:hypothetical protein